MVVVQEPASASEITVEPPLDGTSTGQDGLHYRVADLGALDAGKPLPITLRYTKSDSRPSAEILKPKASALPAPATAPPTAAVNTPVAPVAAGGLPDWALPLAGMVLLGLLGVGFILWRWRRESRSTTPAGRTCAKCGAAQAPGNRFCGNCGAKVA